MHSGYAEVDVDERAFDYLISSLSNGLGLSRELISRVRAVPGRMTAVLPAVATRQQLYQFTWALVGSYEASYDAICTILLEMADADSLIVAESPIVQPGDPEVADWPVQTFHLSTDLYVFVTRSPTVDKLTLMLRTVDTPHDGTIVVTRQPSAGSFEPSHVDQNDLAAMATQARLVAVRAYDGDGYVIWRRDS